MVRYAKPDNSPGVFIYDGWQCAGVEELPEIAAKLAELNK